MTVFTNTPLKAGEMDYEKWPTINGVTTDIHKAREDYLRTWADTLEYYMEHYPSHANYKVWENYFNAFEDELDNRF